MMLLKWSLRQSLLLLVSLSSLLACGPGRGGIRRRGARKMSPLVYKQHVPNFSERSLAASGLPLGPVFRDSDEFRRLEANYNPDIVFKDEEMNGADRIMTPRCKERLNTLSIAVLNQWPGVRLRVIDAWDENHSRHSLHDEGRAVDITTSDRDRAKYGMLARLAVEAGFDWVYYESRAHIHASCKAEPKDLSGAGGCFSSSSTVLDSQYRRRFMHELRVGDEVLVADPVTQEKSFSRILLFLDRDPLQKEEFVHIETNDNHTLVLTKDHLLFVAKNESKRFEERFASDIEIGDMVLVHDTKDTLNTSLRSSTVSRVHRSWQTGVFAPMTESGTIVVDDILASCYALVHSQNLAHAAFWPIRLFNNFFNYDNNDNINGIDNEVEVGIHWYPWMLYKVVRSVLPWILRI